LCIIVASFRGNAMFRCLVFAALVFASPAFAQTCRKPDAAKLDAARAALMALPVGDGMQTDVSPKARAAITAMKARLGEFVAAALRCAGGDPKAAARALARFDRSGPDDNRYGGMLKFQVRAHGSGRLSATASFGIACGADTMLMVFARDRAGWREVLRAQSAPYDKVSGAWGDFRYELSPPDAKGDWFAVTTTVAPWCSSTWSEIRYQVVRPSKVLFRATDPIWWGGNDVGRLKVGAGDFTLRFRAQSIDGGVHNREWVRRFAVQGDKVVRIPPLADTPRDFVEEWIEADWKDAARWTAPALVAAVKEVHDKFHANPYGEYRSVRDCGGGVTQIQIVPDGTDGNLYFKVAGERLVGLSNDPDPRCKGKVK
jgi:hypothetical protein